MISWALVYIMMIGGEPAPALIDVYESQEQCEEHRHQANIEASQHQRLYTMVCVPEQKFLFERKKR